MEFSCIRLFVRDFDASFRFYSEVLGLHVTWGKLGDVYASFDIGLPSGLTIFSSDLMAEALGNSECEYPSNHRDKAAIILKVEHVDKQYAALKAKGVEFLKAPYDMSAWGLRVAHFRDPEGNLIELWSELSRANWDKGLREQAEQYEAVEKSK